MRLEPLILVLVLVGALPASAADCNKPLQLVTSLPMTPIDRSERMSVPISLNGVEKQFMFDTGGSIPQVSGEVVDELKLPRLESGVEIYAVNGAKSRSYTRIDQFAMGALHGAKLQMLISPPGMENILTPVSFPAYDFDMDFAARKLNLLFSDHCEGKVIYWPAKAVASVPITVRNYQISVPVTVDGHHLTAIIDTGASTSTMREDIAEFTFDLKPGSDDMKVVGHIGGDEKAPIYLHPFSTLSFEGVTVNNPEIVILTDIVNKNADHSNQTGSHIKTVSDDLTLPAIIVGMDVLRRLHVYLALKERRLYLTEASGPESTIKPAATPGMGQ